MSILDQIVAAKQREVSANKELYPAKLLEKSIYFATQTVSLKKYVEREDKHGIIAEIKRRSPSKGVINSSISVEQLSIGYMQAGASALSVLTDKEFFGGSKDDLMTARKFNFCPILRKDFIIDQYQVIEAKSWGADAVLLIAAVLSKEEIKELSTAAKNLGLEVLLEIHSKEEIEKWNPNIDLVGVNNRNLKDFTVSLETSKTLISNLPSESAKIAESGIYRPEDVTILRSLGFDGFLIGETFMRHSRPDAACRSFVDQLKASGSGACKDAD